MANKNLNAAKAAKKDEFYTEMTDIERELQHYCRTSKVRSSSVIVMTLMKVTSSNTSLFTSITWD